MFEQPAVKSEKDRSRTIMILSGLAILAVIALIIIVTSFARRPSQTEYVHAGSPEFDAYAANVLISNVEKKTGERIIGRYVVIRCTVQNTGDKVLSGLQLKATVIGTGGQLIREKIVTPVPNSRDELGPNQAMKIDVSLERVPEPWEIRDMTIELNGLKLK
jgi:hypothetical protein